MPPPNLLATRLNNQQLAPSQKRRPQDVVSWLGAMQAQDFPGAKWAIGLRARGCGDADIEQAFNDGRILRTHVLRPTWHFVAPADIRWILKISAPRVHAVNAYYYRQLGLDAKAFDRACAMLRRVLEGGNHLSRAELSVFLRRARMGADGLKLAYVMMHAELEGVICSGPRRGKQFTYALLDERVPHAKPFDTDRAFAELAQRYFRSHGPATLRDFVWWSGLTTKAARDGIASARPELVETTIDGVAHWSASRDLGAVQKTPTAFLLPNYDEYLVAYKDRGAFVDASRSANEAARTNSALANHLVIDGKLAGSWGRTLKGSVASVDVAPYRPLTPAQKRAALGAADCYGEFLNLRVECRIN